MKEIAIIAGSGNFPIYILNNIKASGKDVRILGLKGIYEKKKYNTKDILAEIPGYKLSSIIDVLKKHNIKRVVFAGYVKRMELMKLIFDSKGKKLLKEIISTGITDKSIFAKLCLFLEREGFTILPTSEFHKKTPNGVIGKIHPSKKDILDINQGKKILNTLSQFDIGQSIILKDELVLALETVCGTDKMMEINKEYIKGGILIKISKKEQDKRLDAPCIGKKTFVYLNKYKLKGIAIDSKQGVFLDMEEAIKYANKNNIFIYGI